MIEMTGSQLNETDWVIVHDGLVGLQFLQNQFSALLSLGGVLEKLGPLENHVRWLHERIRLLSAEEATARARLAELIASHDELGIDHQKHTAQHEALRDEVATLKAEHDRLTPLVAEHQHIVAELPAKRAALAALEAEIAALRKRFAA
jgi:chromosome segregation ATPase